MFDVNGITHGQEVFSPYDWSS